MTENSGWFEVDKRGLAQLVRRRGVGFILNELAQNAWDTNATQVQITVIPLPNKAACLLTVWDDDPDGFKDLTHAYTLYAPSEKKGCHDKRGRFNLGEKLVLAACTHATIQSTKGTVVFQSKAGKLSRTQTKECYKVGSQFQAEIPMTREEIRELEEAAQLLLPPIPTIYNGQRLNTPVAIKEFVVPLATEIADSEGNLRRSVRKTTVRTYSAEKPYIYEMGIPVVESGLPWSVEVMQKIPLNMDRDNVTPAYLRNLSVQVLNHMHERLVDEEETNPLIQEALGHPDVKEDAVHSVLTRQYGEKRAIFDPSDPEANHTAAAAGYTLIPGRAHSKKQWANIRGTTQPAGKIFPTVVAYGDEGEGEMVTIIPESEWTPGMKRVAKLTQDLGELVTGKPVCVIIENELTQPYAANYAPGRLVFNAGALGYKWFDVDTNLQAVLRLIIHELGHHFAFSHLDDKYQDGVVRIGSMVTMLALEKPEVFR